MYAYIDLLEILVLLLVGALLCAGIVGVSVICSCELVDVRTLRRLWKNPRFGILGMMGTTAAVAIDLTMMRWLGIPLAHPIAIACGLFLFVLAVAIVGLVAIVFDDLFVGSRFRDLRRRTLSESVKVPEIALSEKTSEALPTIVVDQDD